MNPLIISMAVSTVGISPVDSITWRLPSLAFENPAVKQWMLPASHSAVQIEGDYEHTPDGVVDILGNGERRWEASAGSYMKAGGSTVWGAAAYSSGRETGRIRMENSEPEMVYPYFTVDTLGGDMNVERYGFGGGYASAAGRWAWGLEASYKAGLYYRSVDPRPRNTTGRLEINAGGAFRLWRNYHVGVSLEYMKYKQSSDIDFKSQMGIEKIYHTTGLGHHYVRFAGTGYSTAYSGHSFDVASTLYPSSGRGFSATAAYSRHTMTKILTDLNKLPLARVIEHRLRAQITYIPQGSFGIDLNMEAWRRRGYENIFGDASSGVYPMIGSAHRYSHTGITLAAGMLRQWHPRAATLVGLRLSAGYGRNELVYLNPAHTRRADAATGSADIWITMPVATRWRLVFGADYNGYLPFDTRKMQDDIYGLTINSFGVRTSVSAAVTRRIALRLSLKYTRLTFSRGLDDANAATGALAVIF